MRSSVSFTQRVIPYLVVGQLCVLTQSIRAQTGAPEIVAQSDDIVTFEGNQITLRVQLSDETERPIEMSWWMNGTAIPATEIWTFLAKAGAYWFTVSNRFGMATSRVIRVTVVEPTGVSGVFDVSVPSGGKFTVIPVKPNIPNTAKVNTWRVADRDVPVTQGGAGSWTYLDSALSFDPNGTERDVLYDSSIGVGAELSTELNEAALDFYDIYLAQIVDAANDQRLVLKAGLADASGPLDALHVVETNILSGIRRNTTEELVFGFLGSGFSDQLKVRVAADADVESEGLYYGIALRRRLDPWIRFERVGEGVLLRWGNGLLEAAPSVRGPWTWIRVMSPSTQPSSGGVRLFRVRAG